MGEVYKARDTRIDRSVAIKALPAATGSDVEAEGRFEREARALAALSHPRICALFEFARLDGRAFLVMEYLQGQSLAERLARGRLPLDEALRTAIEIADALAAAHRAGLVHRDLKPGNVMLTKSGAKLLDFGLAKALAGEEVSSAGDPTRLELTRTGIVVGTVPFMAPEQLDGRPVDHRTDIWAFGCLLFEMVTGKRAFEGPTAPAVAAAILEREPPVLSNVDPPASPALARVVRKCLSRDPDLRWHSAADLCDELQWIASGGGGALGPAAAPRRRIGWRDALFAAATGAAVVVAALLTVRPWRESSTRTAPSRQLELTVPRIAAHENVALSPDGSKLAFIATGSTGVPSLWVRSLANGTTRPVAGADGVIAASALIWSPDGDNIAFVAGKKFRRVNVATGQSQTIADVEGQIYGGEWAADGTILLGTYQVSKTHGIHSVPAAGGQLTPITTLEPDVLLHASPKLLPDGRRFMFLEWAADERRRDLCVASLDAPAPRCFGLQSQFFGGLTDQFVVYARDGRLFAHSYDSRTAALSGNPIVVAERLAEDRVGRIGVSVAGSGTLAYVPAAYSQRQLVSIDRRGTQVETIGDTAVQEGFDADGSGRIVAVERLGDDGIRLWLIDAARKVMTRVDTGSDVVSAPVLSQDGARLTYIARQPGRTTVIERTTHGGGRQVLFDYRGEGVLYLADRSWDGLRTLVGIAERNRRVGELVAAAAEEPVVVAEGRVNLSTARVSPDSKWLAFSSTRSGRSQVYVSHIPPTGDEWQISASGGEHPQWRGDGRELFFIAPDGSLMSTAITTTPRFDFTSPQTLFKTGNVADWVAQRFVSTADGERFLFNMLPEGDKPPTTTTLHVILNWSEALPR